MLEIPVIVTEQNPRALGVTVPLPLAELPTSLYSGPISKTRFSMWLPEVEKQLKAEQIESVVIFVRFPFVLLFFSNRVSCLALGDRVARLRAPEHPRLPPAWLRCPCSGGRCQLLQSRGNSYRSQCGSFSSLSHSRSN